MARPQSSRLGCGRRRLCWHGAGGKAGASYMAPLQLVIAAWSGVDLVDDLIGGWARHLLGREAGTRVDWAGV